MPVRIQTRSGPAVSLDLDATISESHNFAQTVTEHPVEKGAAISDHARPKPRTLRLEGMVSNTPILTTTRGPIDLVESAIRSAGGETTRGTRVATAYAALLSLEGRICDVTTELQRYTDVVLETLEVPRNAQLGDVLRFSATFKAIITAQSETVRVSVPHGNGAKNKGQQPTSETKRTSILHDLDADLLGGFLKRAGGG